MKQKTKTSLFIVSGLCTALSLNCATAKPDDVSKRPLTVADAIQTTRLQGGSFYDPKAEPFVISPDGRKYVTIEVRGDIQRNGVIAKLIVGDLSSLAAAQRPRTVATLFTPGLYVKDDLFHTAISLPGWAPIKWTDAHHVAFFWEDRSGVIQANLLDIDSGTSKQLSGSATDLNVFALGVSADGSVLYSAYAPHPSETNDRLLRDGFAVTNEDAFSLISGHLDGTSELSRYWDEDWFLQRPGKRPVRIAIDRGARVRSQTFVAIFSPDSRHAVLDAMPLEVPASWLRYEESWVHEQIAQWRSVSPDAFDARQLHQFYLLDVSTLGIRPLMDAPALNYNGKNVAWSPDSRSIVVGPTFLPVENADPAGLSGHAMIEIDPATLHWSKLPIEIDPNSVGENSLRWIAADTISITTKVTTRYLKKSGGSWAELPAPGGATQPLSKVKLEVREALNTPPTLVGVDRATGREALVLDPNKDSLSRFSLGKVEVVHWKGQDSYDWTGLLYYPVGYSEGKRYPLVLQTHGVDSTTQFSLYGVGTAIGPSFGPYAAQTLAGCGIAVLQIEDRHIDDRLTEALTYTRGYEAGVQLLVDKGIVDANRVGIEGFSRTGWYVEYALTHSSFKYAAALAADHIAGSYVESTLAEPGTMEDENGGPPVGDGLKKWLENAPDFNVEKVNSPLLMQRYSGPLNRVLSDWETFARLRRLHKPVELYVLPDIEHGGHNLQNPRQILAAKETAVDWFDFWLNGHENSDPKKAEQYARWHKLREMQH